jgi:WD40 repeat protein
VAYSRDGSPAYASTIDGTILRWDMKTLQRTEYHTPSHSGPAYISRMDVGPDGKSLAYIDGGGLWLWNQITSGGKAQLLFDFTKLVTDKRTPALSFQNSLALAYTTRGSIEVVIAPGCNDSSPIAGVIAWNAATAKLSAAYSLPVPATLCPAGPYNIVDVAAIRPDGLRVAISCNNAATAAKPTCPSRQIQLWDLSDPKNAVQLVNALADTTHGPDPTKPANPAPPPNPYIPIGKLVYADGPQGLRVVGTCPIVGSCSFARFWDFALSAYPSVLSTGTVTNDASFDNLGNHLALGGCANVIDCSSGSLQLWDVTTPTPTRPTPARLTEPFGKHINLLARVALSPDGKRVLTQQFNDNALAVWDLDTVDPITERVSHTDFTVPTVPASPTDPTSVPALSAFWYQAALSPDGATLAELVYAGTTAPNVNTISLRLTRVSDQSVIKSVPLAADTQVVGLSFSADGSRLVAVMPSHIAAWKWDGHTLSTLPKIGAGVGAGTVYQGFSMSADGKLVAVTHNPDPHLAIPKDAAGQIELWDTDTGKMRGSPLKKEKSIPYQVALSPDGGSVATAYYPDTVVNPSAIDFTAYFDHAVSVWDVAGQHRHDNVYSGHDTAPAGLIYSPDGRHLSSIDLYGRVIVWDTQTKQAVSKINAFDRQDAKLGVNASFSPDGRYVVFSGGEFDAQSGGFGAAHDVITILDIAQNQKYVQPITNLIPGSLRIPLVVNVQVDAGARHLYYTVTRDTIGETYVRDLDPSAWIARACQVAAHPALTQSDWSVLVGQGQPPAACMG